MITGLKKTIAAVAAAGALTLGGGAVANAATIDNFVEIPDVAGSTGSAAEQTLEDAGFVHVHLAGPGDATAIGTNYQKGTEVDQNAQILVITD